MHVIFDVEGVEVAEGVRGGFTDSETDGDNKKQINLSGGNVPGGLTEGGIASRREGDLVGLAVAGRGQAGDREGLVGADYPRGIDSDLLQVVIENPLDGYSAGLGNAAKRPIRTPLLS